MHTNGPDLFWKPMLSFTDGSNWIFSTSIPALKDSSMHPKVRCLMSITLLCNSYWQGPNHALPSLLKPRLIVKQIAPTNALEQRVWLPTHPFCISNRRRGQLASSSHCLSPRLPPRMWVERGLCSLAEREASEGTFILLHTSLKRSQVQRGCRDPPRATLTRGAKAASRSMTWNWAADFAGN